MIIYDSHWGVYSTMTSYPFLEVLKRIIDFFQMPLFFSISGFCFFYSGKLKIKKKLQRLLIPFLVFLLLWVIPFRLVSHYPGYANKKIYEIVLLGLIGKDSGHLWYLLSLLQMFIIFNFVIKIKSKPLYIICTILMVILSIYSYWFTDVFRFSQTLRYLIFFKLGYDFNKYKYKIPKTGIISLAITITGLLLFFFIKGIENTALLRLFELVSGLIIVLLFYNLVPDKSNNSLKYISDNSFGLYLIHSPMIYPFFYYAPNINVILMLLNNFVLLPSIILFLLFLIRKTKLRLIIGETQ